MEERVQEFKKRGFELPPGGSWMGINHFALFESEETGNCFETTRFASDWEWPKPDEWFPPQAAVLQSY